MINIQHLFLCLQMAGDKSLKEHSTVDGLASQKEPIESLNLRLSDMRNITAKYKSGAYSFSGRIVATVESATSFLCNGWRWLVVVDDPELAAMPEDEKETILAVELYDFLNRKKYITQ